MLKLSHLLAALSVISSARVLAEPPGWIENGQIAAQDLARGSSGPFGAMLVLTDNWDSFVSRWEQTSPGSETTTVRSIQKGHPLVSAVIFTGCKPDHAGNCLVTGDFRVIDPNGKTYAKRENANIWSSPPPDPQLQLSVESLGLSLDPPDPLGTYIFVVRVTDHVANRTLELRTPFEAK